MVVGAVAHNTLVDWVALETPDGGLLGGRRDQRDRDHGFAAHQL
jgi:hypothetical protein